MSVPSSRKLFCSGRAPLIEILGVRPPTTSFPAASAAPTPGCRSASCWNERPLSGRSRIWRSSTSPETAPEVRLIWEASAETLTSLAVRPSSSFTSMTAFWPTASVIPLRTMGWNPGAETCSSYSPGGSTGNRKRPRSSLTCVWAAPVPTLRSSSVAPATTAPLGSRRLPCRLAPTVWAPAGEQPRRTSPANPSQARTRRCVMAASFLPLGDQQNLSRRLPRFERAVGGCRVAQGELAIDRHRELSFREETEDVARAPEQLLARRRIVTQARPGQEERSFRIEDVGIERRHRPARLSEKHHEAQRLQAVQAPVEGIAPDRVVYHLDSRPRGDLADRGLEVGFRVAN